MRRLAWTPASVTIFAQNSYYLPNAAYDQDMWTILWILIVIWAVLAIVGFAIKGLLWLALIGIVLFIGTIVFGFIRRRAGRSAA